MQGFISYIINNDWTVWAGIGLVLIIVLYAVTYRHRRDKRRVKNTTLSKIDRMTGEEFEDYLASLFRLQGWKVNEVGGSGDYGADLIIKKLGETYIIQAKRYSDKVSLPAVQQAFTAKAFYDADGCTVVTNSFFTKNAKTLAAKVGCELIDRNGLTEYIETLKKGKV